MPGCIAACLPLATGSIRARPINRPANQERGDDHDRATDAQGRLEDHVSPVSVHAGEFRRQDRGRPRRRADQDGAASSSPEQFGFLGSSFFFLFSISAIVVGFIVNRVDTRWVLLAMAVVWALAQFPMVGTVSFTTLVICRIILGAGEGPAFSVAAHAIYKWFPDEKRTLPTAILSQGSAFGVILAVPALNWIIVNHSWHYAFGALGVVGLMWVVAWLVDGQGRSAGADRLRWPRPIPACPISSF